MKRRFVVGGNWKMNGNFESINDLTSTLLQYPIPPDTDVIVSPPSIYLDYVVRKLASSKISVSAQNCYKHAKGAYTGEISPQMLIDVNVGWVILGHSERRNELEETNELINDKVLLALDAGLKVILCVGEKLEERKAGKMRDVVFKQLSSCTDKIPSWENLVIAYEPVWAIGTGNPATPEEGSRKHVALLVFSSRTLDQAQEAHKLIREWLVEKVSPDIGAAQIIIYGGSVNAANCKALVSHKDIDGFLVGGASLKPTEFFEIISARQ